MCRLLLSLASKFKERGLVAFGKNMFTGSWGDANTLHGSGIQPKPHGWFGDVNPTCTKVGVVACIVTRSDLKERSHAHDKKHRKDGGVMFRFWESQWFGPPTNHTIITQGW